MTFSILAKDPNSKEIGIAIATYSLAVGATCPFYVKGNAVITSQSSTNPKIGGKIKQLIENNKDPENSRLLYLNFQTSDLFLIQYHISR